MGRSLIPFDQFQSDLHRQWKQDRAFRQRLPRREFWRGCLGLAALLEGIDDIEFHGNHALYRNDQVTWVGLRDVPVGHFPASRSMNGRDVNYANTARATLRHGMPVIDFAVPDRRAVDFRFFPHGEFVVKRNAFREELIHPWADVLDSDVRTREFGVLNQMSRAMTHFACFAIDPRGRPYRRPWVPHRPAGGREFRPVSPRQWMPRAYLGFTLDQAERLYHAATQSGVDNPVFECPCCHRRSGVGLFREAGRRLDVFEDGNFVADCPWCGRRRKWHLEDALAGPAWRRFPSAFRDGFCEAVAAGFPLVSVGSTQYLGRANRQGTDGRDGFGERGSCLKVVPHLFRCERDGAQRVIYVPSDVRMGVKPGQELQPGELFAHALQSPPPRGWQRLDPRKKWATAYEVCGGMEMLGFMRMLWFHNQALSLPGRPDLLLYPADLVSPAVRDVLPQGLWWDFHRAGELELVDMNLGAVIFPPLRLRAWDRFGLEMPGDVAVDAGIADPRFDRNGVKAHPGNGVNRGSAVQRLGSSLPPCAPKPKTPGLLVA